MTSSSAAIRQLPPLTHAVLRGNRKRTALPLLQLVRNLLDLLLLVQIRRNEVGFALARGIHFLAGLFAGLGVARGYVDSCAVLDKALADHAADAFGAAGDENDFALDCVVRHGMDGVKSSPVPCLHLL